ncbi:MAG: methyltransferase family protein [Candidatus Dormibacteria bacterium]
MVTYRLILGALLVGIGGSVFVWTQMARGAAARGAPAGPTVAGAAVQEGSPLQLAGPYGLCRHPMLLGALCVLAGMGLLKAPPPGTVAVLAAIALVAIFLSVLEERALERRHGDTYRRYRSAVPFLIPGARLPRRPRTGP